MLTIRLQRTGTKNKPAFRLVLAEAHRAAGKQSIEVLGHYNPRSKQFGIKNQDRLNYWLSQHVQLSPTVHNLFVEKKLIDDKKVKSWRPKIKDQAEAQAAQPSAAPAAQAAPVPEATEAKVEPAA